MIKEKEQIMKIIKGMPDDTTVDDVMEELHFRMQVDHGLKQLDEGKGIAHAAVKKRFSRWLKK